jgi:hypothetical protein
MHTIPVWLAVLTLAQANPSPVPPEPVNACTLITKQEAVTAIDEELREPKASVAGRSIVPGAAASSCEFTGRGGLRAVQVHVWRVGAGGAGDLKKRFGTNCEQKSTGGLAGFGDGACWYSAARDEVQVLKGVTLTHIVLRRQGDATEPLKALTRAALARLP